MSSLCAGSEVEKDHTTRGRTRDRSLNRVNAQQQRFDESSTLRGRSRQRATSLSRMLPSRNTSPSSFHYSTSHTHQLHQHSRNLLQQRTGHKRREHCPSRRGSPTRQKTLQRRQRSKSRQTKLTAMADMEMTRISSDVSLHSSLRNEVVMKDLGSDDGNHNLHIDT